MKSLHGKNRSRGLTLLELVIVMTIIVAIAGVAVAMFPRLLTRAHVSSCAANIPELLKAIQMYESVSLDGYPDRMDTLCVGDALANYLPRDDGELNGLYADKLDEYEAKALNEAGINQVTVMTGNTHDDWHASFWPYAESVVFVDVDEKLDVAFLEPSEAQRLGFSVDQSGTEGADDGDRFVVFGLGSPCRMFGRTMNEAPVHFSDAMKGNPNDHYMRFVAVYQVGGRTNTANEGEDPDYEYDTFRRARLRGVLAMHPGGLEGIAGHIGEYWDEVESEELEN